MSKHAPAPRAATGGLSGEYPTGPRVVGEDFGLVMAMRAFLGRPTGTTLTTTTSIVGAVAGFSSGPTPPASPSPGDRWWRTDAGVLFTYIDDGTTQQWVEV